MLDDFAVLGRRADEAALAERVAIARALTDRLAQLTTTAEDSHGLVRVTLAPSGAISGLHLHERTRDRPAAETSRLVLAVIRVAQRQLIDHTAEACAEVYGPGSLTAGAVVAAFEQRFMVPRAESAA
jgi:YbaB/EbfC DNA-binding family